MAATIQHPPIPKDTLKSLNVRLCWLQKLPYLTDSNSGLPDFLLAPQPQLGPTGAAQYLAPGEGRRKVGKAASFNGNPRTCYHEKTSVNPMFHGKTDRYRFLCFLLGHNKVKRHLCSVEKPAIFAWETSHTFHQELDAEHWRTPGKPLVVSESGRSSET